MLQRGRVGPTALSTRILFFILIALVIAPGSALHTSAQSAAPVIETAQLRLWPEYDDPGLLVIFAGQFASATTFPLQAAFPAPSGVRNVQATYQNASSSLINQPFEIKNGAVTYELPSAGFQLEYYLDRAPGGDQRSINYSFVAPYAINTLKVEVQQPARSSSFTMTPASESSQQGSDGLTYYIINRRNVAAGEKIDITVKYSKADTGLSAPQLAVAPTSAGAPAAAPAPAPASASTASVLPWLLIGLGVLLLAGIVVYWLLSQRKQAEPAPAPVVRSAQVRPRPSGAGPRPTVAARPAGGAVSYCTNCGNALKAEDRFCSQCGSPRRS